jgi:phosphoribosylformimino-5-aminoimidazole carboxamide ribotide isomerase
MLVIPAIDLRQGKCIRLQQGRKDAATVYGDDPVKVAEQFARDGARMLHVVDLDGAFSESNLRNREVLRDICSALNIPLQFGGGLRGINDVEQVISMGTSRVVIGTLAAESPDILAEMVRQFGAEHIAVGIDARNGQVMTRGWETEGQMSALTLGHRVAAAGIERIVYTDIQRDGMLTGPNIEQTCRIALESGLKVTASGGVASLEDLRQLKAALVGGLDSVIVGKAFYEGRFTLPEALRVTDDGVDT